MSVGASGTLNFLSCLVESHLPLRIFEVIFSE